MHELSTPKILSLTLSKGVLSIQFEGETEAHKFGSVPQDVFDSLKENPTFDNFALLIRPHYRML